MAETLVVGIGDPMRGDDGLGPAVVERLRLLPANVCLETHWGEGAGLMALWRGWERVILVDAMTSGIEAGTLRWFDAERLPAPGLFPHSTHRFGLAEALAMSQVLGELPAGIAVLGIEGRCFLPGAGLSPEAAAAVEPACEQILRRVQ